MVVFPICHLRFHGKFLRSRWKAWLPPASRQPKRPLQPRSHRRSWRNAWPRRRWGLRSEACGGGVFTHNKNHDFVQMALETSSSIFWRLFFLGVVGIIGLLVCKSWSDMDCVEIGNFFNVGELEVFQPFRLDSVGKMISWWVSWTTETVRH